MTSPGRPLVVRLFTPLLVLFCLAGLLSGNAGAFDVEAFRRLDRLELKAAEASLDDYVDRRSGQVLRPPRNAAEAYVARRQQRLAARLSSIETMRDEPLGGQTLAVFGKSAQATRLVIDEHGRARIQCVPAAVLLGRPISDFRHGNRPPEVQRQ